MRRPDSDWDFSESGRISCGTIFVNAVFPTDSGALTPANRSGNLPYGVEAAVCEMISENGRVAWRRRAADPGTAGPASRLYVES